MFSNVLINLIFEEAKNEIFALLGSRTVGSLYFDLNDASFNSLVETYDPAIRIILSELFKRRV